MTTIADVLDSSSVVSSRVTVSPEIFRLLIPVSKSVRMSSAANALLVPEGEIRQHS